jgi:signal transduction histidine kinase
LLDVTKIEAGQLPWHTQPFDLDALVRETVEEMSHTTQRHQIRIEGAISAPVSGDHEHTGQVLTNLLSNAIKYSPEADIIQVSCVADTESATVSVRDYGIGIASENLPHIFERFFRVSDPEHETFPGLGLGLFISAQMIKRQGGRMWVESRMGVGSIFSFTVPLAPSPEPDTPGQEGGEEHAEKNPYH